MVIENQVMAISVSSNASEESVGTPTGRVILFCTIPTIIPDTTPTMSPPTTHTDTTVTPTEIPTVLPTVLPTSNPSKDPSSDHIPPLPGISPFLSSADDTTDSDTPDTPPSPTHALYSSSDSSSEASAISQETILIIWQNERLILERVLSHLGLIGTEVGVDDDIEGVDESCLEPDTDPVQATIQACFDFADIIRSKGINVRVVAKTVARDEGGDDRVTLPAVSDDRFHDHTPVHRVQVIEGVQREQGRRIVGVDSAVTALIKRIAELERDNKRLRGTASVEGQRVDRLQRDMSRMQRELRQIRRL
ncbi:hypothetical protein Tco_1299409 [Tanacetum coccineum]